jgi:nucleotide-binding universal stress UspA family protein
MKDPLMETAAMPKDLAQPLFRHILVPTDFSHRSDAAVSYALQLAKQTHGQLTLLHVLPEPSALDYTLGGFPETEQDRAKEEASSLLDETVAHAKRTFLEIDSRLRTGLDLRHEILAAAKEVSADLLVLTTHKFLGWKNLFFGSDAEKILEHAPCPILILRF